MIHLSPKRRTQPVTAVGRDVLRKAPAHPVELGWLERGCPCPPRGQRRAGCQIHTEVWLLTGRTRAGYEVGQRDAPEARPAVRGPRQLVRPSRAGDRSAAGALPFLGSLRRGEEFGSCKI